MEEDPPRGRRPVQYGRDTREFTWYIGVKEEI